MSQIAVIIVGLPASGKSAITKELAAQGFVVLNRDSVGGKVASLVQPFLEALHAGNSVVLDNMNLTVEGRAPFIAAAKSVAGVRVECHWMQTSIDDCQVNALNRMYDRYRTVFLTYDAIQAHAGAKKDPNMFPILAMFAAKKKLNGKKVKGVWTTPSGKPTMDEGFDKIVKVPFTRRASTGSKKAIILDYDGTLRADAREHGGEHPYPVKPSEVVAMPNRQVVLQRYLDQGYLLLGVTTQSGIGKGHLTREEAEACIVETNRQIGSGIGTVLCPHYNFPVSCFCRKPQPGLGVFLIRTYDLDPSLCVFVGDQTSDRTFAQRCGFRFAWADDFFGED